MREVFAEVMKKELYSNEKSCLLLGDIGIRSFEKEILEQPKRIINVGILEQSMISIGSGLSLAGFAPTMHTISPFMILRAFEQIKIDFGYQELRGNLVSVGASIDYSALGTTHHCPEDVMLLKTIPNIEILIPGNSTELEVQLNRSLNNSKLTYIRLSEKENKIKLKADFNKIQMIKKGGLATVLVVGPMLDDAVSACEGMDVTILYCNSLKPFDAKTLVDQISGTTLIIIEPLFINSTHEIILEHEINLDKIKVRSLGLPKQYFKKYGSREENFVDLGLDKTGLKEKILGIINEQ